MRRLRAALVFSMFVLGILMVGATALAYRAIVEHWGADPRGTLIAAATVGISFFISMNLLLRWDDRRRQRLEHKEADPAATQTNGPQ
jgi:hypothetical protein